MHASYGYRFIRVICTREERGMLLQERLLRNMEVGMYVWYVRVAGEAQASVSGADWSWLALDWISYMRGIPSLDSLVPSVAS